MAVYNTIIQFIIYSMEVIVITGEEIAVELGITRQAVSQSLKRSIIKVFTEARKLNPQLDYYQTLGFIMEVLKIDKEDGYFFYKKLPRDIQKQICKDAVA